MSNSRRRMQAGRLTVAGCAGLLLLLILPVHPVNAQVLDPVMQLCGGLSPTMCTVAGPSLEIGSTINTNPTIFVTNNDGGITDHVVLLVLVPNSSTSLSFTANFSGKNTTTLVPGSVSVGSGSGTPWLDTSGKPLLTSSGLLTNLGSPSKGGPANYKIDGLGGMAPPGGDLSTIQIVPGTTSYVVYAIASCATFNSTINTCLGTTLGTSGNASSLGQINLQVSFSSFSSGTGFPVGTIFLALGLDSGGNTLFSTPLTVGLEVVPEPSSMLMLGSGLLVLGTALRWRWRKQAGNPAP